MSFQLENYFILWTTLKLLLGVLYTLELLGVQICTPQPPGVQFYILYNILCGYSVIIHCSI